MLLCAVVVQGCANYIKHGCYVKLMLYIASRVSVARATALAERARTALAAGGGSSPLGRPGTVRLRRPITAPPARAVSRERARGRACQRSALPLDLSDPAAGLTAKTQPAATSSELAGAPGHRMQPRSRPLVPLVPQCFPGGVRSRARPAACDRIRVTDRARAQVGDDLPSQPPRGINRMGPGPRTIAWDCCRAVPFRGACQAVASTIGVQSLGTLRNAQSRSVTGPRLAYRAL